MYHTVHQTLNCNAMEQLCAVKYKKQVSLTILNFNNQCSLSCSPLTRATDVLSFERDSEMFLPTPPYPKSTVPGLLLPMIMVLCVPFGGGDGDGDGDVAGCVCVGCMRGDATTSNIAAPKTMTAGARPYCRTLSWPGRG